VWAERDVGGKGKALVVDVEWIEEGDIGALEDVGEDMMFAVPGVVSVEISFGVGIGLERRFAWGTGRRRLRIEDAADAAEMGSVTTRGRVGVCVGRLGGEGGGECW
jgi:hypothetical protein